jgi:succinate dehydrogenase/fumarate reductase flavoprotein subunit
MRKEVLSVSKGDGESILLPLTWVHTLVIGSGAAGLNAAVQLGASGIEDLLIVTEGLHMGTSINTGSDKQTYYKLSLYGSDADAPALMAEAYFAGGSMHGDLALVEAGLSARAFLHLVNLGLPFPRDEYGQFIGYRTDHDPRHRERLLGRATSAGPYTSREMCHALIGRVRELGVEVREGCNVVRLLALREGGDEKRVVGAITLTANGKLEVYGAENVIFAVGGPGGLYRTSVYPEVHTGAIGLALEVGAKAQSLPESQFGLASTQFRWNVSGTYMQVIPRFISTGPGGEREFLPDYFDSRGQMNSMVFLKGYQWPFDSRKVIGGSSLVDILVYVETVLQGRRVFLDFRRNPEGFSFDDLSEEAREYLSRSEALLDTPIERLQAMNPIAVELYAEHGIDLAAQPLEIAVCAQHNNGGLAANHWWESLNVCHLFPVGEVNGSHGVYRPGGSALNAGQVGGFRAAEYIANCYRGWTVPQDRVRQAAGRAVVGLQAWIDRCGGAGNGTQSWQVERAEFQARMTRVGAHVRSASEAQAAVCEAWTQWRRIEESGCSYKGPRGLAEALRNRHLCLAQAVYLEAIRFALQSGVGSRGSSVVITPDGVRIHDGLGDEWRIAPENPAFREKVLETVVSPDGEVKNEWTDRRSIPRTAAWFETAWARFRRGEIYDGKQRLPHASVD